jgi:transposase
MVRHRGRSPRGERLVASVPHGHWKTLTLVAALRINGLAAPCVIDGAMDGPSFLAYVEQILAPTLRKGDTVFMDNLRTHKVDGVLQAVEAVGAKLRYLPAYSPDLNPIEMAFSKLKTALRKGAARTVKALMKLIGKLLKTFAPEQCANYFRHAGYARPISTGKRSSVAMGEIVAVHSVILLEMTDDGLDGGAAAHLSLDLWGHPPLLLGCIDFELVIWRRIVAAISGIGVGAVRWYYPRRRQRGISTAKEPSPSRCQQPIRFRTYHCLERMEPRPVRIERA